MICKTKDCVDNIGGNNPDIKTGCGAWGDNVNNCKDYTTDEQSEVSFEAKVMPNEVLAGVNKRWKPKEKEIFYYVNFYTGVTEQVYTNSKIHTPRNLYKIGNCYKTKEEAQIKWDQIKRILIQR